MQERIQRKEKGVGGGGKRVSRDGDEVRQPPLSPALLLFLPLYLGALGKEVSPDLVFGVGYVVHADLDINRDSIESRLWKDLRFRVLDPPRAHCTIPGARVHNGTIVLPVLPSAHLNPPHMSHNPKYSRLCVLPLVTSTFALCLSW